MSDADRSLEILISTKADLAGAKTVEEQLDQDAAKAKALGAAYDELEGRPTGPSPETDAGGGNEPSDAGMPKAGADGEPTPATPGGGGKGSLDRSDGADRPHTMGSPVGREGEEAGSGLQAGIEGLRLAVEALGGFFGVARNRESSGEQRDADSTGSPLAVLDRGTESGFEDAPDTGSQETHYFPGRGETDTSDIPGEARAIQSSGEKMRAALEQNMQITVLTFNRTLDLIEEQNRRLGDVDRRITELSGQIKSLKNL